MEVRFYDQDAKSNEQDSTETLTEAIEWREKKMRAQRLARLRLIAEALGLVVIIVLAALLILNRPRPCECAECPDSRLLTNAFDQAWQQTWPGNTAPQPDMVTGEVTCWRVAAFDFSTEQGEYRATRCTENADATQIKWHWVLWVPGGGP